MKRLILLQFRIMLAMILCTVAGLTAIHFSMIALMNNKIRTHLVMGLSTEADKSTTTLENFLSFSISGFSNYFEEINDKLIAFKKAGDITEMMRAQTLLMQQLESAKNSTNYISNILLYSDFYSFQFLTEYNNSSYMTEGFVRQAQESLRSLEPNKPHYLWNHAMGASQYKNLLPIGYYSQECFVILMADTSAIAAFKNTDNSVIMITDLSAIIFNKNIPDHSPYELDALSFSNGFYKDNFVSKRVISNRSVITSVKYKLLTESWDKQKVNLHIIYGALIMLVIGLSYLLSKYFTRSLNQFSKNIQDSTSLSPLDSEQILSRFEKTRKHHKGSSLLTLLIMSMSIIMFVPTIVYAISSTFIVSGEIHTIIEKTTAQTNKLSLSSLDFYVSHINTTINNATTNKTLQKNLISSSGFLAYDYKVQDFVMNPFDLRAVENSVQQASYKSAGFVFDITIWDANKTLIFSSNTLSSLTFPEFENQFYTVNNDLYYSSKVISLEKVKIPNTEEVLFFHNIGWICMKIDRPRLLNYMHNNLYYLQSFLTLDETIISTDGQNKEFFDKNKDTVWCIGEALNDNFSFYNIIDNQVVQSEQLTIIFLQICISLGVFFVLMIFCIIFSRALSHQLITLSYQLIYNNSLTPLPEIKQKNEIAILISAYNDMILRIKSLIEENHKNTLNIEILNRKKKELELIAVQNQIDSHFLYNIFANLSLMLHTKQTEKSIQFTTALSKMFKQSIYRNSMIVPVHEEYYHLLSYLELQKLRFDNRIEYEIDIDNEVMDYNTLKLVLQPLAENSFKHGIEPQKNGKLYFHVYASKGRLIMICQDNGVGISPDSLKILRKNIKNYNSQDHFGLANINQRIQLNYGAKYGVYIFSDTQKGTTVIMTQPICTKD